MIQCYNNAENNLQMHDFLNDLSGQFIQLSCNCLPACTSITYDAEISQARFDWKQLFSAFNSPFEEFPGFVTLTLHYKVSHWSHEYCDSNQNDSVATVHLFQRATIHYVTTLRAVRSDRLSGELRRPAGPFHGRIVAQPRRNVLLLYAATILQFASANTSPEQYESSCCLRCCGGRNVAGSDDLVECQEAELFGSVVTCLLMWNDTSVCVIYLWLFYVAYVLSRFLSCIRAIYKLMCKYKSNTCRLLDCQLALPNNERHKVTVLHRTLPDVCITFRLGHMR